jgi:ribonuclease D
MPLDPQVQAVLDVMAQLGAPALHEYEDAAAARAAVKARAVPMEPTPVHRVEDRPIPGPAGAVPVRIYWPSDATGLRPPKGDRLTDWLVRPLDGAQRRYAAADVEHLLTLHAALTTQLEASGRLRWAEDECERLRLRARGAADPETAWWRIKEARSLRGRSRAIAQTVAAWRERTAATTDQPVRWVLPDLAVVAIAQRPPRTADQLRAVRGLDGRFLRNGAARSILAAVEEGVDLPADDVNVPPTEDELDRALRPAHSLLSSWMAQRAGELHLDPTLLGTRADLQAYLRGDADARLRLGWRHELVGAPLQRLLDGEVAVAFERGRGLVLVPAPPGPPSANAVTD